MRVVLHAGFHKTGTTSLQRALADHAPQLAPVAHVETRRLSPGFAAVAEAAREVSLDASPVRLAALVERLEAWMAGLPDLTGRDLVASSEDISGHMPGRSGLTDYRAVGLIVPVVVSALRRQFPMARISVLYTTRAAGPWLKSLHWQLARFSDLRLRQRRFCKDYRAAAEFEAVLAPLKAAMAGEADLCPVALESLSRRRLGPVEAIYDLLQLPETLRRSLCAVPRANVAPPAGLADHFVTLNRAGLSPEALEQSRADLALLMRAYPDEDA